MQARDEEIEFAVTDHGRGIPDEEQEVIFERFRRRKPGEAAEGVGLGLYIVRSLVKAQGGEIAIDSTAGQGSTFRVTIPERHPAHPDESSAVPPPPSPDQIDASGDGHRPAAPPPPPPPPVMTSAADSPSS